MKLRPCRLEDGLSTLDRPVIIQLGSLRSGHYAILRPVGRSGRLVQFIDPTNPSADGVYRKDQLTQSSDWTGYALAPQRLSWGKIGGFAFIAILVSATGVIVIFARRRAASRV